ncbi:MAG: hypothetical protein PUH03_06350 [bacterium]|nr:hypothetical protein [bacterium]MDY2830770.1 hypothetical protein [Alphaproteobacteria bacterium]
MMQELRLKNRLRWFNEAFEMIHKACPNVEQNNIRLGKVRFSGEQCKKYNDYVFFYAVMYLKDLPKQKREELLDTPEFKNKTCYNLCLVAVDVVAEKNEDKKEVLFLPEEQLCWEQNYTIGQSTMIQTEGWLKPCVRLSEERKYRYIESQTDKGLALLPVK